MWALGTLGYMPEPELLVEFEQVAVRDVHGYRPTEIVCVLNGFITIGHKPSQALVKPLCQKSFEDASLFKPSDCISLLRSLSELKENSDLALQAALVDVLFEKRFQLTPKVRSAIPLTLNFVAL